MKKYFSIILFAAVALSCTKEAADTNEVAVSTGRQISFTVKVEGTEATSATISSSSNFTWESSDRAAVFSHEGEKVELSPSSIDGGNAVFTGTMKSATDYIDNGALVVYPADRLTGSKSAPTVTFPASYSSASATQGPVLAAQAVTGGTLAFKYLAGTVAITITDVPTAATSFYVNTRNAANDGDVMCTGTYTVTFTDGIPSLTNETSAGQNVTITNTSSGSTTLYIPLPTPGEQKVYLDVKTTKVGDGDNSDKLFSKGVSLTGTKQVKRNSFISMPSLTINPSVYMISDMTSWDHDEKVEMTKSENTASISMNAPANKCWRPIVVYPTGYWVFYGFTGSDSSSASGTFNNVSSTDEGSRKSAKVSTTDGNFTFSFNYVTGAYSTKRNGAATNFWTGDSGKGSLQVMTKLSETKGYNVRKWQNNIYAYYNSEYTASRAHWDVGSGDKYYLFLYNFSSNTLTPQYFTASDKSWTNVWLCSNQDNWAWHEMTNISGTPVWYYDVDWSSKSTEFCFIGRGSDWTYDSPQDRGTILSISGYTPTVSAAEGNCNYSVAAGKYTIMFCDDGRKIVVLTRS